MPAIILFAGTKNSCPGTRMARSYNYKAARLASCGFAFFEQDLSPGLFGDVPF